jgi:hypothetical protein
MKETLVVPDSDYGTLPVKQALRGASSSSSAGFNAGSSCSGAGTRAEC